MGKLWRTCGSASPCRFSAFLSSSRSLHFFSPLLCNSKCSFNSSLIRTVSHLSNFFFLSAPCSSHFCFPFPHSAQFLCPTFLSVLTYAGFTGLLAVICVAIPFGQHCGFTEHKKKRTFFGKGTFGVILWSPTYLLLWLQGRNL